MNNVLLVGNGFDLAHELPTKYEHFLYLMKNWDEFIKIYDLLKKEMEIGKNNVFYKYVKNVNEFNENNIEKLGKIINNNSWVKYFCKCGAEIDKWIDFEREIYPVMELFEFVFNSSYVMSGNTEDYYGNACIEKRVFSSQMLRKAKLWDKYISTALTDKVIVNRPFASMKYGILKKKITEELRKEFNEFIEAFEIYLLEFVQKKTDVGILKQIKEIGVNTVISFNYTFTEKWYGISEDTVHHIHGMIRTDLSTGKNNMVMGVNEQENQNMDFIYFVKYFQRIQKASGVKYKDLIQMKTTDDNVTHTDYILHIYGHSLDETDEDILKYVIGDKDVSGRLKLKPKKVKIYYYDDEDYEQKVINLIKLYGRVIVEEYMEKELFKFVETSDEEWSE